MKSGKPIHFLDVRPEIEFGICHLPSSISTLRLPFIRRITELDSSDVPLNRLVANPKEYLPEDPRVEIYVICRLGNDSQLAAEALRSVCLDEPVLVRDIVGGLRAWSREVDSQFPIY